MSIELLRGRCEQIGAPDKSGAIECVVGGQRVKVHKHIVEDLDSENEIIFGGPRQKDVVFAYALRNTKKEKTKQADVTNLILLTGVCAYIGIMFSIFVFQDIDNIGPLNYLQAVIAVVGYVGIANFMGRVMDSFRAGNVVRVEASEF